MRSRAAEGKWISMDVKRFVAEWFKNPKDNIGLSVHTTISGQSERSQRIIDLNTQADDAAYVPFLEIHVSDARKHRTKRTIGLNCDENMDEKRCCRYPLTVDFEEFGWDWIIAPKKYEANYCSGECPYVFLQNYPHTHIVSMASPAGSPGPCCAPRKMSSISMLYFDPELNIIYGLLPGMVVERCGCS
ncbi:TGFB [Nesidiocoris tenuis]|uniref:TGFB n=1 Tax=Nesidiocoris tenuis TaxID=355587 RepID=A0ABN7A5I0_9HEMI|nr:TGFB [Nesidiocoris tenuis]